LQQNSKLFAASLPGGVGQRRAHTVRGRPPTPDRRPAAPNRLLEKFPAYRKSPAVASPAI